MAKITFAPIVATARGKVAGVVFSVWKGVAYVRTLVIPANPQSDDQVTQREGLANTLTMWQSIKSWAKTYWDTYAEGYAKSGYNRYVQDNIAHTIAGTAGKITPYNPDFVHITGMDAAAGAAGEIDLTWTQGSGVDATMSVRSYYRKTETDSEEYAWTEYSYLPPSIEAMTMSGLDTGEEYEVAFFCHLKTLATAQQAYNEVLVAG